MENRLEGRRVGLALILVGALLFSLFAIVSSQPALADHIADTGQIQSNCVEFQVGATGEKSPSDFPGVDITLASWADDDHTINFTIAGLAAKQYVDISVKSGSEQAGAGTEESGPYLNGSHTFTNSFQQAISHVRLCVFEEDETTTTSSSTTTSSTTSTTESTTTTEATTTTTEATTTTTEATTTTTQPTTTTTIEDEVLGTVITTSTTVADEVLDTEVTASTLPFTGSENEHLAMLAMALLGSGILTLLGVRSMEKRYSR